jgi:hypothetical protein
MRLPGLGKSVRGTQSTMRDFSRSNPNPPSPSGYDLPVFQLQGLRHGLAPLTQSSRSMLAISNVTPVAVITAWTGDSRPPCNRPASPAPCSVQPSSASPIIEKSCGDRPIMQYAQPSHRTTHIDARSHLCKAEPTGPSPSGRRPLGEDHPTTQPPPILGHTLCLLAIVQ